MLAFLVAGILMGIGFTVKQHGGTLLFGVFTILVAWLERIKFKPSQNASARADLRSGSHPILSVVSREKRLNNQSDRFGFTVS
jgi:hypothetical protein